MEYIKIMLIDLPIGIDGMTVDCSDDAFIILINTRLTHEKQCQIYDREVNVVNCREYGKMVKTESLSTLAPAI